MRPDDIVDGLEGADGGLAVTREASQQGEDNVPVASGLEAASVGLHAGIQNVGARKLGKSNSVTHITRSIHNVETLKGTRLSMHDLNFSPCSTNAMDHTHSLTLGTQWWWMCNTFSKN